MKTKAYTAKAADQPLEYYEFERREPNDTDVVVEILYSGICHSDIHTARGDWGDVEYPCVPGHEIVGKVVQVGKDVTNFEVGDTVGIGCMVNSCGECKACKSDFEQACETSGPVWTYSSEDPIDGSDTKGGYSDKIVVTEKFVVPMPESLDITKAAPLLCAGITMYSPLAHWQMGPGKVVGILGLGGLGHMGVKIAKAMGTEVWVITSSPEKGEDARKYGADGVVVSSSEADMESAYRKFDLIVDTIPVEHDLSQYLELLAINGTICLVGPINPMPGYHGSNLMSGRKSIAGSGIGSIKETQEMLEFCAKHDILPDTEMITMDKVNEAWDNVAKKGMSHRYVIDIQESFGGKK
ncbi:NAD(P)-dependent alcohol dehydrogenase [Candidatus Saccharibacteria bacterium]|nr:NAD(P)-dependent alcohol dehydrogenase [Candidatus Saccharibacteria bacterium]